MTAPGEMVLNLAEACVATPFENDLDLDESPWWRLDDLIHDQPDVGLAVLCEITARVDGMDVLAVIGAGPIEDLLCSHPSVTDKVLDEARRSPNFRKAFRCVWTSRMEPAVKARVDEALALYGGNL